MRYRVLIFLALSLVAGSCRSKKEQIPVKFTGETQGTYYVITYYNEDGKSYQNEVDSLLKSFDQSVSLWEPLSIISRINKNDSSVMTDSTFRELFRLSKEVYKKTDGAFDPTVGPLVNAWGFGFTDSMSVDQHVVDSLLPLVGFDKVKIEGSKVIKKDPRIQFDFDAIAQGYAVDIVGKFLESRGISDYLIDIGGEVLGKGEKPKGEIWKVGIERPKDNATYGEGLKAILNLHDMALSTSGSYRKFYIKNGVRYSHTIDPKTGYPVQHSLLSVSVLAPDCVTADAYATAFMVLGLDSSKKFLTGYKGLEAYFIFSDGDGNMATYFTPGMKPLIAEEME